jgi:hypothetical protein
MTPGLRPLPGGFPCKQSQIVPWPQLTQRLTELFRSAGSGRSRRQRDSRDSNKEA